jgi:hypothetical protein
MSEQGEQWVKLTEAAKELGIAYTKLSRLVATKRISSKKTAYDERVTLVDLNELRRIFGDERKERNELD